MATLTLLRNQDVIFNVEHSVGKYERNHAADVQLVQYLLNLVIEKPTRWENMSAIMRLMCSSYNIC